MADLHFVDFALIPSPVRKEKQFRLPDDFFDLLAVFSHERAVPHSGFPHFYLFSQTVLHCTAIRKMFLYMTWAKQEISKFPLSEQPGPQTVHYNAGARQVEGGLFSDIF